jgi:hypothetical protein
MSMLMMKVHFRRLGMTIKGYAPLTGVIGGPANSNNTAIFKGSTNTFNLASSGTLP